MQTILVIYEPAQVRALSTLLASPEYKEEALLVIALDLEVEFLLEKLHIPFRSGREYQSDTTFSRWLFASDWTKKVFLTPAWSFFNYRSVPFTEVFYSPLLTYIQRVLYFIDLLGGIAQKHPELMRLVIPQSLTVISATTGYLAQREVDLVSACAKVIGEARGFQVEVLSLSHAKPLRTRFSLISFSVKRVLFGFLLGVVHTAIDLLRTRGKPRVLVSDYWRHIAPVFSQLTHAEIILLDRKEVLRAGIKNIWKFRIHGFHFDSFSSHYNRQERKSAQALVEQRWKELRFDESYLSDMTFNGYKLRPLIVDAIDDIVGRVVSHTLEEVDEAYTMVKKLKPDSILVRTSVSAQTHFAVLVFVGKALKIPTIELQHGLEYLGPGSGSQRHVVDYVGVYGKVIQEEMESLGFSKENLPIIGSPRFDRYAIDIAHMKAPVPLAGAAAFRVLCIAPIATLGESLDTYAVYEYFLAVASAIARIPGAHAIIKLRPSTYRDTFYHGAIERAFVGVSHEIAQYERLFYLYNASDAVVSCYSTAALEAMQCKKPLILFGPLELEAEEMRFHFTKYADAGALLLNHTQEELYHSLESLSRDASIRAKLSSGAEVFLKQHYAFDGNASKRLAELLRRLSP